VSFFLEINTDLSRMATFRENAMLKTIISLLNVIMVSFIIATYGHAQSILIVDNHEYVTSWIETHNTGSQGKSYLSNEELSLGAKPDNFTSISRFLLPTSGRMIPTYYLKPKGFSLKSGEVLMVDKNTLEFFAVKFSVNGVVNFRKINFGKLHSQLRGQNLTYALKDGRRGLSINREVVGENYIILKDNNVVGDELISVSKSELFVEAGHYDGLLKGQQVKLNNKDYIVSAFNFSTGEILLVNMDGEVLTTHYSVLIKKRLDFLKSGCIKMLRYFNLN